MSNNNVPGSNQNVNVQVRTLTTDPNVTSQYKTKILHKNVVNGVNTLTQAMMNDTNTKYVVKYDFTLAEDITIPANCILEFDGGSVKTNGHIITLSDNSVIANAIIENNISGGIIKLGNYCTVKDTKIIYSYTNTDTLYNYSIHAESKTNLAINNVEIKDFNSTYNNNGTFAHFSGIRFDVCNDFIIENVYIHDIEVLSENSATKNAEIWPLLINTSSHGVINKCIFDNIKAIDSNENIIAADNDCIYIHSENPKSVNASISITNCKANNAGSRMFKIYESNVEIDNVSFANENSCKEFLYTKGNNLVISNALIKTKAGTIFNLETSYSLISNVVVEDTNVIAESLFRFAESCKDCIISNFISNTNNDVVSIVSSGATIENVVIVNCLFNVLFAITKYVGGSTNGINYNNCIFDIRKTTDDISYYEGGSVYRDCIFNMIGCSYGLYFRDSCKKIIFDNCVFNVSPASNIALLEGNHAYAGVVDYDIYNCKVHVISNENNYNITFISMVRGNVVIEDTDLSELNGYNNLAFMLDTYGNPKSASMRNLILSSPGRVLIDGDFERFIMENVRSISYDANQEVVTYNRSAVPPVITLKYLKDVLGILPHNWISN